MKTYLVTGGAGFIGSNFIHYLYQTYQGEVQIINLDSLTYAGNVSYLQEIADKSSYYFIKGDVCDSKILQEIITSFDIDFVVHFAAETHVDRSIEEDEVFIRTNVLGTQNLLKHFRKAWETSEGYMEGKRFLYVSTDEVYGQLGREGYFTESTPMSPRNPYSASKAGAELLVQAYYETYQFPAIRTRGSNNYGPHQNQEKLIPQFIHLCLCGEKLPVYGDGLAVRDWIHVKDHCKALDMLLKKGAPGEVYNIGSNCEKTTLEIADIIVNIFQNCYNRTLPTEYISYVADRKGHDRRYALDASKIKEQFGWEPEFSFLEGLKETIEWYIEQKEKAEGISRRNKQG